MELPEYTGDMTRKLFYEDSHRKEFEARVLFCAACKEGGGFWTVLDQTCFFPEGGGQYADTGYLGEVKVLDARERDGVVYHRTEAPLEPGDLVCGRIDWEERFEKMQQHTGEHIVSGLVHSRFGYNNVGFHLGSDYCTMDFDGPITPEELRQIEWEANRAVGRDIGNSLLSHWTPNDNGKPWFLHNGRTTANVAFCDGSVRNYIGVYEMPLARPPFVWTSNSNNQWDSKL